MFISPMLLHYAKDNLPFNDKDYLSELKLDGIRLIVSYVDELKIYTRHNNDVTSKFKELVKDCPIPKGTVIDGELIVSDEQGKPDFEAMMSRFHSNRIMHKVTFCAFDIIRYNGIDVTGLPLLRRKELLECAFEETDYYKKVQHVEGDMISYFNIVKQHGLEGTVLKLRNGKYEIGTRSKSWLKVINYSEAEVVITGFWKDKFGWLIGYEEEGKIKPVGTLELGIGEKERKATYPLLKKMITGDSKHHVYVEPRIKVKVKFRNWTSTGLMRLSVFQEFVL